MSGWHRISRLTLVVTLLVLAVGVASALAWQAHRAAQSHHQAAERVLRDYVSFAGWEFSRAARRELETQLDRWLDAIACGGPLPEPAELAGRPGCRCDGLVPRALFSLDTATGDLVVTGGAPGVGAEQWIRASAALHPGVHLTPRVVRIDDVDGRLTLAAGRFIGDTRGQLHFTGFVADAVAALEPVFAKVLDGSPLLPATLAGSRNDLLGVMVGTPRGISIFASGDPTGAVTVDGFLDESIGGLPYHISLRPDAAGQLIIGGLPRSRLPLLLGLLALTAGLLLVALLQLRREHELSRLRTDFVSSITHELRTPLAQIRLFSETLLLGRVRSEAEGRRSLEIIQQESRRLAHLVDNVLYFSRTERGAQAVAPVETPLAPIAREVLETFAPLAQASGATLQLDVRHDVPALADPGAVRQILLNLLDNAVKYGRTGQAIVVTVDAREGNPALTVDDQGAGVPAESRQRIWEPYSRLATAAASATAGTGIGLAVVRELAVLHGGDADVEDAPGGGARFVIRLPAARNAHGAPVAAAGEASGAPA